MAKRSILISLKVALLILSTALFSPSCQNVRSKISVPSGYTFSVYARNIPRSDGLTFDKSGGLYATCEESKNVAKILKIRPRGKVSTFVKNLNRADGIVYDASSGCFLLSEEAPDGRILKINPNGKAMVLIPEEDIENPEGMVLNKSGDLFIAEDRPSGRILRFSNDNLVSLATGLKNPEGITMDSSANLFVAETGTGRILKLDSTGKMHIFVEKGIMKNPDNIIYDSRSNVFFVTEDRRPGRILRITVKGKVSTFASGLAYPQGMASDSEGNLFVSEQGLNRVIKISQIQ